MRALTFICSLLFCQGCFVYHYTTTPSLSGTVKDFTTKQPITYATVGFKKHDSIATKTALDGTFHLDPDHAWDFCWIMPGEFWSEGGIFFVDAAGYEPFEQKVSTMHGTPYIFKEPIELHRDSK
jgi:hypothetical protein